jgi:tryptophanyl-tRNA synthetase
MHLGNYHGTVKTWLELQQQHDCYFFIPDLHALTTSYQNVAHIHRDTRQMVIDWLAMGLDPKKCTIFVQSKIPAHAELHLLLSMITPVSWLERVPTYKDQQQKLSDLELANYGFLGYPLLQSADVLLYQATHVPVGEDQVAHIEFTREVVRRFNNFYGDGKVILPEPQPLLTKITKLPGLDGKKMSKSYNNTIEIGEDKLSIEKKIKIMPTDPARVRRSDCGDPEQCPVWSLHKVYSNQGVQDWVQEGCRAASIGCVDCKKTLAEAIEIEQQPIREKANVYKQDSKYIDLVIEEGTNQAAAVANKTLATVKQVMGIAGG